MKLYDKNIEVKVIFYINIKSVQPINKTNTT